MGIIDYQQQWNFGKKVWSRLLPPSVGSLFYPSCPSPVGSPLLRIGGLPILFRRLRHDRWSDSSKSISRALMPTVCPLLSHKHTRTDSIVTSRTCSRSRTMPLAEFLGGPWIRMRAARRQPTIPKCVYDSLERTSCVYMYMCICVHPFVLLLYTRRRECI